MNETTSREQDRLSALCALDILDTPPEERFDKITRLAAAAFSVPIALVSLVDAERQWFKSCHGLAARETPRWMAFCHHAIDADASFVVPDATADTRFAGNPLVTGEPHIRFYAGHPVRTTEGLPVGTLCVIDTKPRSFSAGDIAMLASLAGMVEAELNRDALVAARTEAEAALGRLNAELEQRIDERTVALQLKNAELQREIHQRTEIETTLRRSEERVRSIIDSSFSAFVAANADGAITDWNGSAERVFGWKRDEVLGRTLSEVLVPARFRSAHDAGMARAAAAGRSKLLNQTLQLTAVTKSGHEIAVEMSLSTYLCGADLFFGAFLHDVSERMEAKRQLEQKQGLLDAVLETVDVGVIACDATGALSFFNRAAREYHGQQAASVDNGDWAEHYDLYDADGKAHLAPNDIPLLRALAGHTVKDTRMVIAPRGMKRRTVLASGRRLVSSSGENLGAAVAMKDITELSEWQDRLRASEQMLRSITENLPTMIGQVDRHGRFVFLNARSLRFYGQPAHKLLGQPVRQAYTEVEYAKILPHLERVSSGKQVTFEGEHQINGKTLYYHASFVPHLTPAGEPDGYFAMAFDITARREIEMMQVRSEERLKTITDNLPVLISYLDSDLRYQFANAMYKDWLGVPSAAMIGKTLPEVFGAEYFEERRDSLTRALAGQMSNIELTITRRGHQRILSTTYMPHTRDGQVVGVYVLATDATAAREHERQLFALANSDPLTGLPNRRMYEFQLEKALATARRQRSALALMYLDLDNFKRINDTHGHGVGDDVLVEFGRRVKAVLRETDTLARLAGDEFTVILQSVNGVEGCELVASKILQALQEPFVSAGKRIQIAASIGIALGGHGSHASSLAASADAALYSVKRSGKSRFAILPCQSGSSRTAPEAAAA